MEQCSLIIIVDIIIKIEGMKGMVRRLSERDIQELVYLGKSGFTCLYSSLQPFLLPGPLAQLVTAGLLFSLTLMMSSVLLIDKVSLNPF